MGFFDSISKNPSVVALAALGIGLFIFRDKISGFFSDITGGAAGTAAAAETIGTLGGNLTSNLTLTPLDTDPLFGKEGFFTNFSQNFFGFLGDQQKNLGNFFEDSQNNADNIFEGGSKFLDDIVKTITDTIGGAGDIFTPKEESTDITDTPAATGRASNRDRFLEEFPDLEVFPRTISDDLLVSVAPIDEFGIGGGPSFIGGSTTFGDNLVDTLSEVLNIFPSLTASQARDALEENQGLTGSQFRLINEDVINISNPEENQIFFNSSGGFSGLTPEQIAKLLTGGNINNF